VIVNLEGATFAAPFFILYRLNNSLICTAG